MKINVKQCFFFIQSSSQFLRSIIQKTYKENKLVHIYFGLAPKCMQRYFKRNWFECVIWNINKYL